MQHRNKTNKEQAIGSGLVSVIIPTFNSQAHLEETINSVLAQTHQNFELIVVDDMSTDNTMHVIEGLRRKHSTITLTNTSVNSGGPATPRNIGIGIAKGEYIAFLDSDDLWHPKKLEHQILAIEQEKLDMVCSSVVKISAHKKALTTLNLNGEITNQIDSYQILSYHKLLQKNYIALSSVLIRSKSLGEHRFSEAQEHIAIEDYLLWLTLSEHQNFRCGLFSCALIEYRMLDSSLSSSKLTMTRKIWNLHGQLDLTHIPFGLGRAFYMTRYILRSTFKMIVGKLKSLR